MIVKKIVLRISRNLRIIFILPFVFYQSILAEENPGNIHVAVMNFHANNCDPSLARAVSEMIAGKIFHSGQFVLLERTRMDFIAESHGRLDSECADSECVSEFGKMLDVEKMVSGSLSRLGKFRIEVRIIDVATGGIDMHLSGEAEREELFEESIEAIVHNIGNYYSGNSFIKGDFELTLSGAACRALGDFSRGIGNGYGLEVSGQTNRIIANRVSVILSAGLYEFKPRSDSIYCLYMAPISIGMGYPIRVLPAVTIMPLVSGGYAVFRMRYDPVVYRPAGDFEYQRESYFDPLLSMRIIADIHVFHRWHLSMAPTYSMFFEHGRRGHFSGLLVGVKAQL